MRNRPVGLAKTGMVTLLAALAVMAAALARAQPPTPKANPNPKVARNPKGAGPGAGGAAPARPPKPAVDPLAPGADTKAWAPGTFHYTLKLVAPDDTTLAASYYPSKLTTNASAVLLIHEKDRSSKDFEEPIGDLKGQGLAEYLQDQGHAVLALDLRGQGANFRRPLTPDDWKMMINDLQAAYLFLVDRTNRGELNLAKLSVIGLGEGANLAAAWAYQPGAGVSSQGRTSDLCALVLISPMADGEGLLLGQVLGSLAPRLPLMIMVGKRDHTSYEPVRAVRPIVERPQFKQSKIEEFDSSLHGYKLLRLEPRVTSVLTRFLEGSAKYKAVEWEPRYNLSPVSLRDITAVRNSKPGEAAKAKEAAAAAPAPPPAPPAAKEKAEAPPK